MEIKGTALHKLLHFWKFICYKIIVIQRRRHKI
jgi:hypothetical protein